MIITYIDRNAAILFDPECKRVVMFDERIMLVENRTTHQVEYYKIGIL